MDWFYQWPCCYTQSYPQKLGRALVSNTLSSKIDEKVTNVVGFAEENDFFYRGGAVCMLSASFSVKTHTSRSHMPPQVLCNVIVATTPF